jgi:Uma2 family endonuclease
MTQIRVVTLEQWLALPEADDSRRLECVRGELVMAPPPTSGHGWAQVALFNALTAALPDGLRAVIECEVALGDDPLTVRNPDVAVVTGAHGGRRLYRPDEVRLVVEVLSPSNRRTDLVDKLREYAEAGIPEYWIVDLDTPSLTVFRLAGSAYELVAQHTSAAEVETCGVTVRVDVPTLGT